LNRAIQVGEGCDIDKVVVMMMMVEVVVGSGGQLLEGDVLVIRMTSG
jgi:hypothetical protein